MADLENILNDDEFFADIVDTTKEGIEQHKKREYLKSVIDKGKGHFLGSQWTHGRLGKGWILSIKYMLNTGNVN